MLRTSENVLHFACGVGLPALGAYEARPGAVALRVRYDN